MKRLTRPDIEASLPENIIVPSFNLLWKKISPQFSTAGLESKIQTTLEHSIAELPRILQELWNEPATVQNIARAKILFFRYALQSDIPAKLSKSKVLQTKTGLTRVKLRQHYNSWFTQQIKDHQSFTSKKSNHDYAKQRTILQLLILEPTTIYQLPI